MRPFPLLLALLAFSSFFAPDASACQGRRCSSYDWSTGGDCGEWTPTGVLIRWVHGDYCRRAVGTQYDWSTGGDCGEWTPTGVLVRWVNADYCRRECGVVRKLK